MSIIYLRIVYSAYTFNKWSLNITFLLLLFAAGGVAPVFATGTVPLTSIYALL